MRYITLNEVLVLHERIIGLSGGSPGIRDFSALESALAQPMITFNGEELYPGILSKASALGFLLISNHPFVDGNKRVGHAAMEALLFLNGYEINSDFDEQEHLILDIASGKIKLMEFLDWLRMHVVKRNGY